VSFDDAMHHEAMSFTNGEDRTVRVLLTPLKSGKASFKLVSAGTEDLEAWHTHMTGTLRRSDLPSPSAFSAKQIMARCPQTWPVADLYESLGKLGLEYGSSFRGIRELYVGQHEALTKVRLPDGLTNTQYAMHPAFLDACLHAYPFVLDGAEKIGSDRRKSYLPISLAGFRCHQDGIDEAWAHISLRNVENDNTQVVEIRVYDMLERPVAELEGLTVRLLPLDKVAPTRAAADDVFYRVAWRKSVRSAVDQEDRAPASWLIFADAKGVGAALASRLESAGHHSHLVYRGGSFAQQEPRKWTANERQPRDFRRLLEQFAASEALPCDGVVYLWGLDAPSMESLTLASLKSGSEMMCRGALAILHALDATRSTTPTGRRLWIVTANTQRTECQDQRVDPVQAPLWGLGRAVAFEYPGIWGGLIDLQFDGDRTPDIDLLAAELLHPNGETQIAISAAGQRNVPRFVRQSLAELPAQLPRVRADGTYLVIGGLGMLGRAVSKWLLSKGAKNLVLTGRSASSKAAHEVFSTAEINGATIHVIAADISLDEDVSRLMQTISNELPPLRGVVQSAGVLDDGILAQLDWDRFARLFEPRVYGSWLLHEYTKSLELDFFVLKSSLWSLLGSAGQGNYIASSTFLDSLAAHRRIAGLPATVVNWCAWSGGGLATVSGARGEAMLSSMGMKFISPDLATQMFDKLMHRDVDQIAVAVADWSTYASKMGKSSFLAELLNRNEDSRTSKSAQGKVALSAARIAVNGQARQQLLKRLQQHIMERLGFVDEIAPDQPLNEIGLDSLMSVSVSNSLEDEFGIPVPVAELISGPTINQLIDGVFRELWTDKIRVAPAPLSAAKFQECVGGADADGDARAKLESVLQRHITAELGFVDPIDPHQPLNEVGLDSSRSMTLANTLKDVFGISISVTELTWGPTISQLADHLVDELAAVEARIARDQYQQVGPQQVNNERASGATPIEPAEQRNDPPACSALRISEETQLVSREENGVGAEDSRPIARLSSSSETGLPTAPKWLIAPRPNPVAKARLFCFPYAGGGLVTFRSWPQLLGESVEMVAVEPPGRGTRINEAPINDIDTFVECLLPEMIEWLDRPSAFFGHCLGGLTMFATLCALPKGSMRFIKHVFACAVRPPHLLKRRGEFEDNLVYDMMLHKEFDIRVPPYAQADEIFVDIVRHFDTPEADKMLAIPALRAALLPTIRAEFGMAYNYKYEAVQPFTFPISSFVGDIDPWVSEKDSAGWGKLTCGSFTNHVRKGSHFLMAEDREYILETINNEFVNLATQ
jgi:surfactin synthase thioesterase subunit/acyl carrier protein/NAD(P)-dependent dehydrogenase (short-subunit alcohol dehydrogenase family)